MKKSSKHSSRMMLGCAAIVLAVVVVALVMNASVLVFALPCMLMMGAMVWMMTGGMGGSTRGGPGSGPS